MNSGVANPFRSLLFFIIWLAPWAGLINRVSRSVIGYPSRQDGAILPSWDTGFVSQGTFIMFSCSIPYNKSFIDHASLFCQDGWILASFFSCVVFASLLTSTSSPSINSQKNLANIQLSWPHAWSITQKLGPAFYCRFGPPAWQENFKIRLTIL